MSGLYTLRAKEIYDRAQEKFQIFFHEQTSINAFDLSITLYHLLEWIVPDGNNSKKWKKDSFSDLSPEVNHLLDEIHRYKYYEVLKSIANTSKHYELTRSKSPTYEKKIVEGFRLGQSVLGEKLGQENLVVIVDDQEVWLRKVFKDVLDKYSDYFGDSES